MLGLRGWLVGTAVVAAAACGDDAAGSGTDSDDGTGTSATATATAPPTVSASGTDPTTEDTTTEDSLTETTGSGSSTTGTGLEVTVEVTQHDTQPMVVDVTLTTTAPVDTVELTHAFDDGVVIAGGGDGTTFDFRLRGLAPATLHEVEYDIDGLIDTFEFTTLAPLPGFIASFEVNQPGTPAAEAPYRMFDLIPFPAFDTAGVFMVDQAGVTRWHLGGPSNELPGPEGVWTAAKTRADGTMMYLHLHEFFIVDELGTVVTQFADDELGVTGLHHEVLELPNGNFLAMTHTFRTVDYGDPFGETLTAGDGIVEFTPEGEQVWFWDSFDYMDPLRITEPIDTTFYFHPTTGEVTYDWAHGNAIEYDPGTDTMLASFRHQDWVLNIDHATGDVLWTLGRDGDFTLDDGEWFFHQHSPQWQPDGTLLIYDNAIGNPDIEPDAYESRVIRLSLDTDAMSASIVWEDDAEPFQAAFAGDADLLPGSGNYIVTDSSLAGPAGLYARVRELDPTASPMTQWTLTTPDATFIYRATAQPHLVGITR